MWNIKFKVTHTIPRVPSLARQAAGGRRRKMSVIVDIIAAFTRASAITSLPRNIETVLYRCIAELMVSSLKYNDVNVAMGNYSPC